MGAYLYLSKFIDLSDQFLIFLLDFQSQELSYPDLESKAARWRATMTLESYYERWVVPVYTKSKTWNCLPEDHHLEGDHNDYKLTGKASATSDFTFEEILLKLSDRINMLAIQFAPAWDQMKGFQLSASLPYPLVRGSASSGWPVCRLPVAEELTYILVKELASRESERPGDLLRKEILPYPASGSQHADNGNV